MRLPPHPSSVLSIHFRSLDFDSAPRQPPGANLVEQSPFLVGPENQLAEIVVRTIRRFADSESESPPRWLNPLVVVGPPGCGKSHFATGLASIFTGAGKTESECIATTAIDFASDWSTAQGSNALAEFRRSLRNARFWLVEDLGRLPQKRAHQSELLYCLDDLIHSGALVVLTSRYPPPLLTNLIEPLRSRLEGGLVLTLAPPSLAVRHEFVRRATMTGPTPLDARQVDELVKRLPGTPRQLLGALQKSKFSELAGQDGEPGDSQLQARDARAACDIPISDILAVTARYFGQSQANLKSASRKQSIVYARSVAMYLARELGGFRLQDIGAAFGGRDHTTVLHACRKIGRSAATDSTTRDELSDLNRLLLAR